MRAAGIFFESHTQEAALLQTVPQRAVFAAFALACIAAPALVGAHALGVITMMLITLVAVLGLQITTGMAGQLSLGQSAFVGVGAFVAAKLAASDVPLPLVLPISGLIAGASSIVFGLPSIRVKGFYLALTTLAAQVMFPILIIRLPTSWFGGANGLPVDPPVLFGVRLADPAPVYWLCLAVAAIMGLFAFNLGRSRIGRAFRALRDNDLAAMVLGVDPLRFKVLAFFAGACFAGVAGALYAYVIRYVTVEQFTLWQSVWYVSMLLGRRSRLHLGRHTRRDRHHRVAGGAARSRQPAHHVRPRPAGRFRLRQHQRAARRRHPRHADLRAQRPRASLDAVETRLPDLAVPTKLDRNKPGRNAMLTRRTLIAAVPALAAASAARADDPVTYAFSNSVDFTGPFADVMPSWHSGHRVMVDWWNDTSGKQLGVKIVLKVHDLRYDTAATAQSWPGILSGDKPILHLGMGTPDLVALMKRLPEDKVPMTMPTAMVGLVWAPNGWEFSVRPTYSHEFAALFARLQQQLPDNRALKIATVSTQGRAGYEDQVNGVVHLAKMYPDRFTIADQQWVDDNPIDATEQVQRMGAKQPDVVMIGATTAQVIAVARARQDLGLKLPIVSSSHNGLSEVAKAIPLKDLEGDFSVFAFAPYNQPNLPARDAYQKYHTDPGAWGIVAAQSAAQTILSLRVLETAMQAAGKSGVTGPAMYDAIMAKPYTEEEMLGMTPTIRFDKSRPFPIGEIKAKALVVRNGEIVPFTEDWMIAPELTKW